jgi:ribonuclease HII
MARESKPHFRFEKKLHAQGISPVCGVDEAGRGPLAGPVVAAAVILTPGRVPKGLNDSKQLTGLQREALYTEIMARAVVGVGIAEVSRIDRDNIFQAAMWAMVQAVQALAVAPRHCLIDGNRLPKLLQLPAMAIVEGDAKSLSIAAASIVAKVTRDAMMAELALAHPGYGFEAHKGYATPQHLQALQTLGPCPIHRRSFGPVAAFFPPAPEPVQVDMFEP